MSISHEALRNELPAYALGTLEAPDSARLERHLAGCAECRQLLREYEEVNRLLPLGLPRTEPSPSARRELFNRARIDATASRRRKFHAWWPRLRLHALTATIVVVAVLVSALVWTQIDGGDSEDAAAILEDLREDSDTQVIPMLGSDAAPQAVAQLFFQPGKTQAGLVVSGLPPLPGDRAYQLWFVQPDETRHNGGVFNVDSSGQAMVIIDAPPDYAPGWRCGVTEEPAGGSDAPTGQNVMLGNYEDYDW